jgi:hypothetical protein
MAASSASNAEVWTHWSTIVKGLKWMLKSDAPLLLNPKPSWHKISWFCQFLAAIPHYEKTPWRPPGWRLRHASTCLTGRPAKALTSI